MKFLNQIDGADKVKQDSENRFVTDTQIANWNSYYRGKWTSEDFNVGGESDIYYPVHITGLNMNVATMSFLEIYRAYSWTAPSDWYTSTHKGGLNLSISYSLSGWGGQNYELQIALSQTYSRMVADIITPNPDTNSILVWLRGGGARYQIRKQEDGVVVKVYDGAQNPLPFKYKEGGQYETIYEATSDIEPWFDFTGIRRILTTAQNLYIGGGYRNPKNSKLVHHEGNKPTKRDVGLSDVDNTSDRNKPVSVATQSELNKKVEITVGKTQPSSGWWYEEIE